MHGEMLTYGLKRGTKNELLRIETVPNGLGCDCVCPHCKHDLIARNKGNKKIPHFAHASGVDCGGGPMTALHMLAQQVLANEMKVMLPDYIGNYHKVRTGLMVFDEVLVEKSNNIDNTQIRPDCIGIKYDEFGLIRKLLIEIRVTHKVDEQKIQHMRDAGFPCVEIDLSDMLQTDYSIEDIRQRLKEEKSDRIWLSCPKYDKQEEKKRLEIEQQEAEKERKKRKNEELLVEMRKNLQTKVECWIESGDLEITEYLIQIINNTQAVENQILYEILVPKDDFVHYVKCSPKNESGLKVFYALLNQYSDKIQLYDIERAYKALSERRNTFSSRLENKIEIEEYISIYILFNLLSHYGNVVDKNAPNNLDCIEKYKSDSLIREQVLMVLSIVYRTIIGTDIMGFDDLTRKIIHERVSLSELFLTVLDNETSFTNIKMVSNDMLSELRQFVESTHYPPDPYVKTILKICYDDIFYPPKQKSTDKIGRNNNVLKQESILQPISSDQLRKWESLNNWYKES